MANLPPLTLGLAGMASVLVLYRWVTNKYPDIHPHALYHQSSISPIRKPDESAVHRSVVTPFAYPLVAGLNIRTEQYFRDGDLRDVLQLAANSDITIVGDDKKTVIPFCK